MKTICLYFQVHQPFRIRRYRFFDIGESSYYYDDYANDSIMKKVAGKCYLPANKLMLELIEKFDKRFRISFSISGTALDQFELYAPEVLESFQKLAATGQVEFLAETYSHSLASVTDPGEFRSQITEHSKRIESLFGISSKVFRNTELVYSDDIGSMVADMGFEAMLTEGARHILGWKSPNYLYYNSINPRLKVLLRNFRLSDDIGFRFSNQGWNEWPLTARKYVSWLKDLDKKEELINIFMDYETFGEHHWAETGIFDFLGALPGEVLKYKEFNFMTPSEVAAELQPVAPIHVPYPASWADEERDLSAWLGNDMQNEAFGKLYKLKELVRKTTDSKILTDWRYLQISDHFYYMSTKFLSDGEVHKYFNPFESPYDAFINYMNVLSDFTRRIREHVGDEEMEIVKMKRLIKERDEHIEDLSRMINELKETPKSIVSPVGANEITTNETTPGSKIRPAGNRKKPEKEKLAAKTGQSRALSRSKESSSSPYRGKNLDKGEMKSGK
ncbi:MAG: glycoside hydrolase family 57 protein [Bacteroidales bacterium]